MGQGAAWGGINSLLHFLLLWIYTYGKERKTYLLLEADNSEFGRSCVFWFLFVFFSHFSYYLYFGVYFYKLSQ